MSQHELTTEIIINASAETVWKILMDFKKFPEWNPFIRRISGEAKVGATLEVFIQPSGGSGMTFTPVVLAADPSQEFRWLGKLWIKGLFDGEHQFKLQPLGDGKVRLIHAEKFSGVLVSLLKKMLDTDSRRGFTEMNAALKQLAEQKQTELGTQSAR
ncbi:MAG: SRPBCC domain-containing protein [Rhizobacter sp.]|nr:SRPBCC domain-containing protein [Chlorobiales bacterium]